jgi:hypothetical protein
MKAGVFLILISLLTLSASQVLRAQDQSGRKLERAIAALRHIDQDKLNEEQQEAKAKEIDAAWETIRAAGKPGVARLKRELRRVQETGEKDDFFKLNAATLLYMIGRFDEAETIAAVWNSTPLKAQYRYVFLTAFDAALTRDARALPLLLACLKDKEASFHVSAHAMEVGWPLNLQFLWGVYGPQGLPALLRVLETSRHPVELQSAMLLLTKAQEVKALPRIREIAAGEEGETSQMAVNCLGIFGHPQDFHFLASGLPSTDPQTAFAHASALYEYEDLRAVPLLVPLLKAENELLRREAIMALLHLASPASLDALQRFCGEAPRGERPDTPRPSECGAVGRRLSDLKFDLSDYEGKSPQEKAALTAAVIRGEEERYLLSKDDRKLTREQLRELTEEWKRESRAFSGDYGWVEERHLLSAATPDDINLLLDVRAAVYRRLSDECLYETQRLDEVIKRLGRSRYRKVVGLTERVE